MSIFSPKAQHDEQRETLFSADTARFETPKKDNRSAKPIPTEMVEQIEAGELTSEQISEIARDFPIFRYKTQITIHGIFPEIARERIGRYKNVFRNQNASLGVRYSAIDHAKRREIADILRAVGSKLHYSETSSEHGFYIEASPAGFLFADEEGARRFVLTVGTERPEPPTDPPTDPTPPAPEPPKKPSFDSAPESEPEAVLVECEQCHDETDERDTLFFDGSILCRSCHRKAEAAALLLDLSGAPTRAQIRDEQEAREDAERAELWEVEAEKARLKAQRETRANAELDEIRATRADQIKARAALLIANREQAERAEIAQLLREVKADPAAPIVCTVTRYTTDPEPEPPTILNSDFADDLTDFCAALPPVAATPERATTAAQQREFNREREDTQPRAALWRATSDPREAAENIADVKARAAQILGIDAAKFAPEADDREAQNDAKRGRNQPPRGSFAAYCAAEREILATIAAPEPPKEPGRATVERAYLLTAAKAMKATGARRVKVETTDRDTLKITAAAADEIAQAEIPAAIAAPFACHIAAPAFFDWVGKAPALPVALDFSPEPVENRLELRAGKSRFSIPEARLSPEEKDAAPKLPDDSAPRFTVRFDAPQFCAHFAALIECASQDTHHQTLHFINLEFENGQCTAVATDTHRLRFYTLRADYTGTPFSKNFLVPARFLKKLLAQIPKRPGDEVEIEFSPGFAAIQTNHAARHFLPLGEGDFPNWRKCVPRDPSIKLEVEAEEFLTAVRQVIQVSADDSQRVVLAKKGSVLTLRAQSSYTGNSVYHEVWADSDAPDFDGLALNAGYLLAQLATIPKPKKSGKTGPKIYPLFTAEFSPMPESAGAFSALFVTIGGDLDKGGAILMPMATRASERQAPPETPAPAEDYQAQLKRYHEEKLAQIARDQIEIANMSGDEFAALDKEKVWEWGDALMQSVWFGGDFSKHAQTPEGRAAIHRVALRHIYNSAPHEIPFRALKSHAHDKPDFQAHCFFAREMAQRLLTQAVELRAKLEFGTRVWHFANFRVSRRKWIHDAADERQRAADFRAKNPKAPKPSDAPEVVTQLFADELPAQLLEVAPTPEKPKRKRSAAALIAAKLAAHAKNSALDLDELAQLDAPAILAALSGQPSEPEQPKAREAFAAEANELAQTFAAMLNRAAAPDATEDAPPIAPPEEAPETEPQAPPLPLPSPSQPTRHAPKPHKRERFRRRRFEPQRTIKTAPARRAAICHVEGKPIRRASLADFAVPSSKTRSGSREARALCGSRSEGARAPPIYTGSPVSAARIYTMPPFPETEYLRL